MTITKLDQFTLLAQSDHLDSQASQSIHHTGYNIHPQRKEQKHQKKYPFKGTQKSTSRRRTKTQRRHTLHGPCRLHDKAAKTHGVMRVRAGQIIKQIMI